MYKYFKPEELKCRCGKCASRGFEMNSDFMKHLDELRELCQFPFILTSAYRCPEHNNKVSNSGSDGEHTTGFAVDIAVNGHQAYLLLDKVYKQGYFTRIGIDRKSGKDGYIHLGHEEKGKGKFVIETVWSY